MPIYTVTDFSRFKGIDMPIVCFNVERYSKEEKQILEEYSETPIIVFGEEAVLNRKVDFELNCSGWSCFVYNITKKEQITVGAKKINFKKKMKEPAESIWIKNLAYKDFIRSEIASVVKLLAGVFDFVTATNRVMVSGVESGEGLTLVLDNPQSVNVKTLLKGSVINGNEIRCSYGEATRQKNSISVTVPANGINVIRVKNKGLEENFE